MMSLLTMIGAAAPSKEATFWMPESASTVAPMVDGLMDFINIVCYIFFALVVAALFYFAIKYRQREGDYTFDSDGPTHNMALEITWTGIPTIIVIVMFWLGMQTYMDLRTAPANSYDVNVTAQKWSWTFQHPEFAVTEANELTVPANRPVRLIMASQDVLHSLYVPAFRVKQDVVPGRYTSLWFEATEPGTYQLYCAEYCGKDHSLMLATVHVLPWDEYQTKMGKLAREYEDIPDSQLPAYAINRLYNRCASCHSLDGSSGTGPSFKGLWDRTVNGTTEFTNGQSVGDLSGPGGEYELAENYIRSSIVQPQRHVVQGFTGAMPSFQGQLKERQIDALVLMMKHLDQVVDADGNIIESPNLGGDDAAEPEQEGASE
ncbi:MAG: cytochrome c oxidase subunit II [Phycisphaerales bacterium]|nr:cytochrome c oxidase subunit II [Phycisphaerales bacterium]